MQKTKLWHEIKNLLGIVVSYRIPPRLMTRKFRQNGRKTIISRDVCKKRNYASKSKTIWELILLIKYLLLYKSQKFRQNRRTTIISGDICKKRIYNPKSKNIWELTLLIKYLPISEMQ